MGIGDVLLNKGLSPWPRTVAATNHRTGTKHLSGVSGRQPVGTAGHMYHNLRIGLKLGVQEVRPRPYRGANLADNNAACIQSEEDSTHEPETLLGYAREWICHAGAPALWEEGVFLAIAHRP